jgi:hypothetical protein
MLIRIIYVSASVGPQTSTMTSSILKGAHAFNASNQITGVLCQGRGIFLQALEGERRTVTELYSRICADKRHSEIDMIHCESVASRRYAHWSMAHVNLSDVDPTTKIVWPEFDPYSATGVQIMERIDHLLASGSVIQDQD